MGLSNFPNGTSVQPPSLLFGDCLKAGCNGDEVVEVGGSKDGLRDGILVGLADGSRVDAGAGAFFGIVTVLRDVAVSVVDDAPRQKLSWSEQQSPYSSQSWSQWQSSLASHTSKHLPAQLNDGGSISSDEGVVKAPFESSHVPASKAKYPLQTARQPFIYSIGGSITLTQTGSNISPQEEHESIWGSEVGIDVEAISYARTSSCQFLPGATIVPLIYN